jgi:hypothetical protein
MVYMEKPPKLDIGLALNVMLQACAFALWIPKMETNSIRSTGYRGV